MCNVNKCISVNIASCEKKLVYWSETVFNISLMEIIILMPQPICC